MEFTTEPTQSVAGGRAAPALSKQVPRHPTVAALENTTESKWTTLLTFFVGDAIGLLLLFGGTRLVAPPIAPDALGHVSPVFIALAPLLFVSFWMAGFYQLRFVHPAHEMNRMALIVGALGGTATLTTSLTLGATPFVWLVAIGGAIGTVTLPICRVCTRVLCARLSWWGLPTVVISAVEDGNNVLDTLRRWPEIGLRPVALLNAAGDPEDIELTLGDPDWAPYLARMFDIPYAVLALPDLGRAERAKVLSRYSKFFDHVFVVTGDAGPAALWTTGQSGAGLHGYSVQNGTSTVSARLIKRLVDVIGAGLGLLLLAPVFAILAVLIRWDSPGDVFFRQERIGSDGQIFTVLKFRTMYCNADERLAAVLENDPERRERYQEYHKLEDDPRVTRIGRFLRRYSLDELPQLLNVLRGDMSLVGPRAYMPSELSDMKGLEKVILQTPPGLTGLWQVSGRNRLRFIERVDLDVHYVQNWSPWLDLYLLIRTVPTVLTGEGAA